MELRQLRYVVAVAETRNFTRAARQCFVAQSALSHQIGSLERELGVKLFARTSRRVELTPAGEAFLVGARQCLEAAERAVSDAAAAVGEVRGELAIGIIPTVTAVDIAAILQRFREQHPRVRVSLHVGASGVMTAEVAAGDLDVAFLGLAAGNPPQGVEARELGRGQLVAVVSPTHALADRGEVALRQLADSPFADFPVGSGGRVQSDQAFEAAGLERDVAYEMMSAELMMRFVGRGLAVALLPAAIARANPDVRVLTLADGPSRVEYLAWSKFNPTPATRAFLSAFPA
ncbi:LysR family transcriptional regulator [Streptomyces aureoverticillatus]|uniref:LysR family transcriptional regulator n=1 Tax=Streptomyces aureoverticillatus TaxID=66871 RepID=UPI0013DBB5D6|nr:LysR family transcriptional regulator [Streptomyces aureoverticillatus]QIB48205.1 LysR family transcriptional regulator [Streptomyces aureoverticillatus]